MYEVTCECYFLEYPAFRPVMELVDSVTGERSAYTGPYTLRVLAGGVSRSDMQNFNSDTYKETYLFVLLVHSYTLLQSEADMDCCS